MPRKVKQVFEGEWLEWKRHERWLCCDCFLTHTVEVRKRNKKLEVRMFRNNRSTGQYRRGAGIKVMVKKKHGD